MRIPFSVFRTTWIALAITISSMGDAIAVELTRSGSALLTIVTSDSSSAEVKQSAKDLGDMLKKISGAEFTIEVGDGRRGIVLGRASDFPELPFAQTFDGGAFHREDYVLRSEPSGLYLLGASDLAVSHAVWDLLHRIGYRQFFPGATWEVIPSQPNLSIEIHANETPDFYARRIWYNWGMWGYNDVPYQQWCVRNRVTQGFRLNSGHAYESIVAANADQFAAHPEYFALLEGQRRTSGGDLKFCIANPGLRKLVIDHAVRTIKANPDLDSISMDPSDGRFGDRRFRFRHRRGRLVLDPRSRWPGRQVMEV